MASRIVIALACIIIAGCAHVPAKPPPIPIPPPPNLAEILGDLNDGSDAFGAVPDNGPTIPWFTESATLFERVAGSWTARRVMVRSISGEHPIACYGMTTRRQVQCFYVSGTDVDVEWTWAVNEEGT